MFYNRRVDRRHSHPYLGHGAGESVDLCDIPNGYRNQINAFTLNNLYPVPTTFSAAQQDLISGNVKFNTLIHFVKNLDVQLSAINLALDIIPQGTIDSRFSLDAGVKKTLRNGKDEFFITATDLLNTMIIRKTVEGQGFSYTSSDFYETQVVRIGYSRKFQNSVLDNLYGRLLRSVFSSFKEAYCSCCIPTGIGVCLPNSNGLRGGHKLFLNLIFDRLNTH